MPTISDELRQAGGILHRQQAEASADASAPASTQVVIDATPAVPTAAQPDEAASNQDPAPPDQVASAGDFANMNMVELMQLDLILNQDPQAATGKPSLPGDLTELSLLDLMNLKVTTEQAPELPDLNPPDHDFRLHDEDPSQSLFNRVSVNLAAAGTLPGTSPVPEQPPPPAPPPPPPGPNVPPDAKDDSYTLAEDTKSFTTSVLANDTDGNGDPVATSLVTGPAHGTLTASSSGHFVYHPAANYNGPDSFTYKVSDGRGGTDTATVTLTVTSVNDPPVAAADSATTAEDTPVVIDVLANDSDLQGGAPNENNTPLSTQIVSGPNHGTLALNPDRTYTYTPDADYNGTDTFSYRAADSLGGLSNVVSVVITVTSVNDPPVANDDTGTVAEDGVLNGSSVLGNDTDHKGAPSENNLPLTAQLVGDVSHGTLVLNANGTYTYTPAADYNGTDSFTYQTVDSLGGVSNTATVNITVTSVNDAPVAAADSATTNEDTPVIIDVLANDSDLHGGAPNENNTPLSTQIVGGPAHGTLTLNPDGTYTYTPNADYNGSDSFTYRAVDKLGGVSGTATVSITVNSVNDPPVANDDTGTVVEDGVLNGSSVLGNDTDHKGAPSEYNLPLTAQLVGDVGHGTLVLNANGTYTYTPDADYNGTDSFTYNAVDSLGGVSNTATVTLTVTSVNDPPVANDDTGTVVEDGALSGASVLANDSDLHGGAPLENNIPLTAQLVGGVSHGTLVLNADGTYTYTPAADYNGTDSFTYHAVDGLGGVSNTATVTITVTSVNDAPVAGNDTGTVAEDGVLIGASVLANDSDLHGGAPLENNIPLTAQLVSGVSHGTLVLNADGTYTYTPTADYNGTDSFTYHAVDGLGGVSNTATVTITVTSVNDAPIASNDTGTVAEDGVFIGASVLANDSDLHGGAPSENNLPLTAQLVADVAHGTLAFNGDRTYTYTPDADYNGTDTFTYNAIDSLGGASNTATVTITVTPVNDPPVANDDTNSISEDPVTNPVSGDVLTNDTDVDSGGLTVAEVDGNAANVGNAVAGLYGTLTLHADGTYDYTLDNANPQVQALDSGQSLSDSFTYAASDGSANSNTATLTITINGVDGNESLAGTAAADTIAGGKGDDTIDGGGGADVLSGGAGNDAFVWHADAGSIDGGGGTNTLLANGSNIDFTLPHPAVTNVQQVDLGAAGNSTLSLTAADVLNITDGSHTLTVLGDVSDTVNAAGGWAPTGPDINGNNVYIQGGATLVVDPNITVNLLP
jgi:VCBS repeat-containing protein